MATKRQFDLLGQLEKSDAFQIAVKRTIKRRFADAKKALLTEFEESLITQEIDEGPEDTTNISNTLSGYGNLFSYIGFNAGDEPCQIIREMISDISLKRDGGIIKIGNQYFAELNRPYLEDFYNATPLPFLGGRSWILGIETNTVGGVAQYIYNNWPNGRSGKGVEVKGVYNSLPFSPQPYFTQMYTNFLSRLGVTAGVS